MKTPPKKSDRRVRRTQKAIERAFAELMAEKDINSITVSELAEKADIHRATFYSHYSDIPELYRHIQKTVVEGIENIIEPDLEMGKNMNSEEVFGMIVDYVYDRRDICKMFLTSTSTREFYEELTKLFESLYIHIFWKEMAETVGEQDVRMLAKYHISGCIAVLSAWAENDFEDTPEKIINTLAIIDGHYDKLMYQITDGSVTL